MYKTGIFDYLLITLAPNFFEDYESLAAHTDEKDYGGLT